MFDNKLNNKLSNLDRYWFSEFNKITEPIAVEVFRECVHE